MSNLERRVSKLEGDQYEGAGLLVVQVNGGETEPEAMQREGVTPEPNQLVVFILNDLGRKAGGLK